jgi:hypothetical protein
MVPWVLTFESNTASFFRVEPKFSFIGGDSRVLPATAVKTADYKWIKLNKTTQYERLKLHLSVTSRSFLFKSAVTNTR